MKKKLTPRKQQALDTKNNIYHSALKLFKTHGFENVTIEMIVKESNVSIGSFYTYFSSKEDIFLEFFKRIDSYYDQSIAESNNLKTNEEVILNMLKAMTEFVEEQLGVEGISVVYYKQLYDFGKIRDLTIKSRSFFIHLNNYVERGIKAREFNSEYSVDHIVDTIVRLVHGLVFDWCLYNGSFDLTAEGQRWFKDTFKVFKN